MLYEFNKSIEVLNVVKDGSYFWFGHYKFRSVNFQTQTATISKPLVIYSKGVEGVSLIEESTGTGTGKRVKNTDNLALNAKTTASPNMYYSGYRTSTPVDLTSYATLMVEGEIFNSTGEGFARVSVSTGATPTTNVKESLISIVNNQLTTRKFEIRVDVSALTGVHYLHFQAIGMNIGECNVRVNKVYLHQLGI